MVDEPQDIADADNDYFDPDEEPQEVNLQGDEDALPGDDDDPALEAEAEDAPENPDEEPGDDPEIDLGDGLKLPKSEIRSGYMRDRDYRQKTAEVARDRETAHKARDYYVTAIQSHNSLLQETEKMLADIMPDDPPWSLAETNPGEYQKQKAIRTEIEKMINGVRERSKKVSQSAQQVSQFDNGQTIAKHVQGLEQRFPHLKGDQQRLVNFVRQKRQEAVELGLTEQEVGNLTDDRLLSIIHYASLGKKAEHNRNNAKRRMQAPKTGQARPATGNGNTGNRKAMQRLAKSGSLKDALSVDFE